MSSDLIVGDPCPPSGSNILTTFPPFENLFLFVLEGMADQMVYACDGVLTGYCAFDYVDQMGSQEPTPSPSSSKSIGSLSNAMSVPRLNSFFMRNQL